MRIVLPILFLILSSCSYFTKSEQNKKYEVETREITYKSGKENLKGYFAYPVGVSNAPAVIVVHEWWGQTEYPRMRARMLAEEGYAALAIDMYGEGKTLDHPKEAGKFAGATFKNIKNAKAKFEAAITTLKAQPEVDPLRVAAMGYCFGGGIVLEMARMGVDLKAAISYHGSLVGPNKAKAKTFKPKLLVFNGAADPMVPEASIVAFKKEMDQAKVDYQFINYPGAKHAFTNQEATEKGKKFNIPIAYDRSADINSWDRTLQFFSKNL